LISAPLSAVKLRHYVETFRRDAGLINRIGAVADHSSVGAGIPAGAKK